jgi:hypothetical protein
MAPADFAISRHARVQAPDATANLPRKPETLPEPERIGRIRPRVGANISGNERNFDSSAAGLAAVDLLQQPSRNLHLPSAKNDKGVVRLPHMVPAR